MLGPIICSCLLPESFFDDYVSLLCTFAQKLDRNADTQHFFLHANLQYQWVPAELSGAINRTSTVLNIRQAVRCLCLLAKNLTGGLARKGAFELERSRAFMCFWIYHLLWCKARGFVLGGLLLELYVSTHSKEGKDSRSQIYLLLVD